MTKPRILIIGAGPVGIGAAWRLEEIGHTDWLLLEAQRQAGGLAGSVVDDQGFTWDYGCHVVHSHYAYFDHLMEAALGNAWIEHVRDTWVWIRNRWVPYPLQNNLWRLPMAEALGCLDGLLELHDGERPTAPAIRTFEDWLNASFGAGLCETFLAPYNRKVWAYPLSKLDFGWVRERVATVDLRQVIHNAVLRRDDARWGPNATFRFPLRGSTGAIWRSLCAQLPHERVRFDQRVVALDSCQQRVILESGERVGYDYLISSMPLDQLLTMISDAPELTEYARRFVHSSCHIIGIGLDGSPPPELRTKSWIYFSEPNVSFHRVTVFSNYSPYNVPRPGEQWSLLAEVSESAYKRVDSTRVVDETIAGFRRCGLIHGRNAVVSRWHCRLEYGYPTPWLGRDEVLEPVSEALERRSILSRGRFGAWKYEVSNQDHSVMQGVEAVERLLRGGREYTFHGEIRDAIELPTATADQRAPSQQ